MKLSVVAMPPTDAYLRALKQVGIDHVVHYQMRDLSESLEALQGVRDRYTRFGLAWKIAERVSDHDRGE
jgi:hypothetical protein